MGSETQEDVVVPAGHVPCRWHGYGGGASYIDMHCSRGKAWDADRDHLTGDEDDCPQCAGTGHHAADAMRLGPMALVRRRELDEALGSLEELRTCRSEAERTMIAKSLIAHIADSARLIDRLESPEIAHAD